MEDAAIDIGDPPWSREELIGELDVFLDIYDERPLKENAGGMSSPHSFYTWYALRKLNPKTVIESGVFRGHSTWLIEQALPETEIISIDPRLDHVVYRSDRARYQETDFGLSDWSALDSNTTLVFFDDHQNAYERLKQCRWFGFRNVIFEDNYAHTQGDFYSLKKAFQGRGFAPAKSKRVKQILSFCFPRGVKCNTIGATSAAVAPNQADAEYIRRHVEIYFEFPPIFRLTGTRWGTAWNDVNYPTKAPLFIDPPHCRSAQDFLP